MTIEQQPGVGVLVGDIKSTVVTIGATSVNVATALTPTSGKAVRIVSVEVSGKLTTAPDRVGIYFGTGAAYTTTPANAISQGFMGTTGGFFRSWEVGRGPVGDVDEVVSWITETETETGMELTIQYTEEEG